MKNQIIYTQLFLLVLIQHSNDKLKLDLTDELMSYEGSKITKPFFPQLAS
ncbi:hypothetical protein [Marinoscillum pacificum]|nr:hypothetical protein [Marinoscillum pacificum]